MPYSSLGFSVFRGSDKMQNVFRVFENSFIDSFESRGILSFEQNWFTLGFKIEVWLLSPLLKSKVVDAREYSDILQNF